MNCAKKIEPKVIIIPVEEELEEGVQTFERDMSIAKRKADVSDFLICNFNEECIQEQLGDVDKMNSDLTEKQDSAKRRPKDLSETVERASFDEEDEAFETKLRVQNEKFQEELRKQKEERERRQV